MRERGFTLIELMVSIVLSAVVIAFVFQIHGQMAGAMRGQATVSEVGESVAATRELIARELRTAGIGFPESGVVFGSGANDRYYGITARDDATGAGDDDIVDFLEIQRTKGEIAECTLDKTSEAGFWRFVVVDPARAVDNRAEFAGAITELMITNGGRTAACVVPWGNPSKITPVSIDIAAGFFGAGGPCETVMAGATAATVTLFERVQFRIDPDPSTYELGVLQKSDGFTGWKPIGIGFTNFQVAVRYLEETDNTNDIDGDGDTTRDWYSGAEMEPFHPSRNPPSIIVLQVGFSIEARNVRRIESVSSSATPGYVDADVAFPDNNPMGNFGQACAGKQYDPCGIPDLAATTHPRYTFPNRVYRSSSTTVWLRNRLGQL